jgi:hypothetical protein
VAITFVGAQTASVTASTGTNTNITFALTGGLASTPANGDLVIVAYSIGSTVARTPAINTAGYTQLAALTAADTYDANLRVGYKRMGSTPDTQVQLGPTGSTSDGGFVTIHVFRGVDATTPLDVTHTTSTGANGGFPDPAAITPATANNVIYVAGANAHGTTGTLTASYATDFRTGQNAASTNRTTMGAGYVTGQAAGVSYNPALFSWSANSGTQAWCAYTIALRDGVTFRDGAAVISPSATVTASAGGIVKPGAAAILPAATVAAATQLTLSGGAALAVAASATASGQLIAQGSASAFAALSIIVDGQSGQSNVVFGSALIGASVTATASAPIFYRDGVAGVLAQLLASATGRLLWDEGAAQGEAWTPQGAQGEAWAAQSGQGEDWTPQAANGEVWEGATSGSKTWVRAV